MNKLGIFYTSDGRIIGTLTGSKEEIKAMSLIINKDYIIKEDNQNINIENNFINDIRQVKNKTNLQTLSYPDVVTVGEDIVISGFPINTRITWPDGFQEIATDGFIETTATIEGKYKFIIDHPFYFPVEVIIDVTP